VVLAALAGCGSSGPQSVYGKLATVNGLTFSSRVSGPAQHPDVALITSTDKQLDCNARAVRVQVPQAVCDSRDPTGVVYAAVVRTTARSGTVTFGDDTFPLTFVRQPGRTDFVFAIAVVRDRAESEAGLLSLGP
jgi:hypothetical protein